MAESDCTQRLIICTILAEVTGNPVEFVLDVFERYLRAGAAADIDEPMSRSEFERRIALMRVERDDIVRWLQRGSVDAWRVLQSRARDN